MARTLVAYTEGKACRTFSASGIGLAGRNEKRGNPAGIFLWRRADRAWSGLVPPVAHNVAVCLVTRLMLLFLLRRIVRWIHRTPADLHQMRRLGHLCQRAVNARCRVKKEIVIGARTLEALMRALRASNSAGPRKTGEATEGSSAARGMRSCKRRRGRIRSARVSHCDSRVTGATCQRDSRQAG